MFLSNRSQLISVDVTVGNFGSRTSGGQALADAELDYKAVEAVVASYCYGEPTCGQRAVYELGLTGVPIFNTNNNCSSGSSALMLAKTLVESGSYDCVMALGRDIFFV